MGVVIDNGKLDLASDLLRFTSDVNELSTPDEVLDHLQQAIGSADNLFVLGAGLLPVRWGDLSAAMRGKTSFTKVHQKGGGTSLSS
jgi:hypothetical protein